ncbi:MAG: hypothetical protein PUH54_00230 [Oscillospiraceae bacterium]|nr:hypothetical protein [Oscillospiraceae bacterium]
MFTRYSVAVIVNGTIFFYTIAVFIFFNHSCAMTFANACFINNNLIFCMFDMLKGFLILRAFHIFTS